MNLEPPYTNEQRYWVSGYIKSIKSGVPLRVIAFTVALSLYISSALVFGHQLDSYSAITWDFSTIGKILLIAIIAFVLFIIFFAFLHERQLNDANHDYVSESKKDRDDSGPNTKLKILTVVTLAIPQIVMLLTVYPGVYGYDGAYSLLQFLCEDYSITSQYSVLFTVMMGACAIMANDATTGIAFAMIFQSAISIAVLYRLVLYTLERTRSKLYYALALLFSALFPFALLLRVSTSQDVLFGAFFLLTAIELARIGLAVTARQKLTIKQLLPLVASSTLMMLARNNGSYAFLAMIVFCIPFIVRKKAWQVLISLIASLALYSFISGPIYSIVGIQPSSVTIREMSSIPSQQLARALEEHPNRISEQALITYESSYNSGVRGYSALDTSWYWSQSEISDVAKDRLNQDFVKSNWEACLATYIDIGIKCPDSYTSAFLLNSLGFWYPFKTYPDNRMYHPYIEYSDTQNAWNGDLDDVYRQSLFPNINEKLRSNMANESWSNIPIASLLLKSGTYLFLFFLCLSSTFILRRFDMTFIFAFCAGFIITLFLSPVCLFRYVYPLLISMPLLFLVFSNKAREANPRKSPSPSTGS